MSDLFDKEPSGRADDSADAAGSNALELDEEAAWEEVEKELSRSPSPPAQAELESEATPFTLGKRLSSAPVSRRFDPLSPLMMVETAFLASAASLIWLINYYFPLGPILQIFFPIPIALTYLRWNSRAAWMGCLVSGLLLSVLMGPARSILYVMPYGLLGVMLGVLWRRRGSWGVAIALGTLLCSFGFFFRVWLVSLLLGDDLWLYATTQVTDILEWLFIKLGLVVQPALWMIQIAVIFLVCLKNLIYMFVVHLVAWYLLDRLGNPIPRPPRWVQVLMDYE